MQKTILFILIFSIFSFNIQAQENHTHQLPRALKFPNIPGYKTLKCDFHQHTVFSDGSVWPDIRVQEALMDGLDAISLTEHLEYQPHKRDIPHTNRNRSYEIAIEEAKDHQLLIVKGAEVTRSMPPGHCNAIFIQDANKLLVDDSIQVFKAAKQQNAFIFWNHPNWIRHKKTGVASLTPMHEYLLKEKLLDGIEVVNEHTYSDEALQIALDHDLTIMGTSDIHGLIDWEFGVPKGGHRPITLVFAKDASLEAIQEALHNKQTVACFKDLLIGRRTFLDPLISACIQIESATYIPNSSVLNVRVNNLSSISFTLQSLNNYTFHNAGDVIQILPGVQYLQVKTIDKLESGVLSFEVLNGIYAPKKHPVISWKFNVN